VAIVNDTDELCVSRSCSTIRRGGVVVTLRLAEQQPMGHVHTHGAEKTRRVFVSVVLCVPLAAVVRPIVGGTTERWSRHINVPFHSLFLLFSVTVVVLFYSYFSFPSNTELTGARRNDDCLLESLFSLSRR
jgi:hypothetical protein